MQPSFLLLCLVLLCAGCSSGLNPGIGTVSFDDGEPVRSGSIEFREVSDGAQFSSRISPRGEFELTDADGNAGIKPGQYEVIVLQLVLTEDLSIEDHHHGRTVPRRYADYYTSDLKYTVEPETTESLQVVLAGE